MLELSHFAGFLIHAGQVDLGNELDRRRRVGVMVTAMDVEAVDTILVGALMPMRSAKDVAEGTECAREVVPVSFRSSWTSTDHLRQIVRMSMPLTKVVSHVTPACSTMSLTGPKPFLPLLEFFKQAKVPRHFCRHPGQRRQ